jgi:hypothetical protein
VNQRNLKNQKRGGDDAQTPGQEICEADTPSQSRTRAVAAVPEFRLESGDLPESYDQTRVVALPIHPYLVHVYWEVTRQDLEKVKKPGRDPDRQVQPCLRFYDVTGVHFDGANAHSSFDIDIDLGAGNWYVHLWSANKSYCVDLGLRTFEGVFLFLARSNIVQTAPDRPSTNVQERYSSAESATLPVDSMPEEKETVLPTQIEDPEGSIAARFTQERAEIPAPLRPSPGEAAKLSPLKEAPHEEQKSPASGAGVTTPADMVTTVRRRLAELYRLEEPPAVPSVTQEVKSYSLQLTGHPQTPVDITEMNERSLAFGISSRNG